MSDQQSWPRDTFATAADWIRASAPSAPDRWIEAIARICKKRKGVWSRLSTQPRDLERRLIRDAFLIGVHQAKWGDLSAWTEGTTGALIMATDEQRELFDYVHETTVALTLQRLKRRAERGNV